MRNLILLAAAMLAAAAGAAQAADASRYPTRPIRFVVPFPAAGSYDAVARLLATKLSERLGQQVVADNRPGAGGLIGTDTIAKAAPDGYTIGMFGNPQTILVNFNPNVPFDAVRDFTPIASIASLSSVVVVHPSVQAQSLKELIELAKTKPGTINYGSGGFGATSHLAGELLKDAAGIDITHVPYAGAARGVLDLLGGRIQLMVSNMVIALPHVRTGKLRPLAVASRARSPYLPDLPTAEEAGVRGFEFSQWYGIVAPKPLPAPIAKRLESEIIAIARTPEFKEGLANQGAEPFVQDAAELARYIRDDVQKYRKIAARIGTKPAN